MTAELADLLKTAQNSAKGLVDLLNSALQANKRLNEQLTVYKRKYKALESVLEALKSERAKDRETIYKWQARLRESIPDLSTDEPLESGHQWQQPRNNAELRQPVSSQRTASSPILPRNPQLNSPPDNYKPTHDDFPTSAGLHPSDLHNSNHDDLVQHSQPYLSTDEPPAMLSQRVLPMSIGVSDLPEDSPRRSDEIIISSSPPVSEPDDGDSDQRCDRETIANKRRATESVWASYYGDAGDNGAALCRSRLEWLQHLMKIQWHPSDFKYNESAAESFEADTPPFHCTQGMCERCEESMAIIEEAGLLGAESRTRDGLDAQETPAGFWRVDYLNSSQVRADKRENEERQISEGRQRLAMTLLRKRYIFRDRKFREHHDIYMQ